MGKEHSRPERKGKDTVLVSSELGRLGQKEGCGVERAGIEVERDKARSRLGPGHEGPCGHDEGFKF